MLAVLARSRLLHEFPYFTYQQSFFIFCFLAIAEVYKNEGNDAYRKKNFDNAIYFYTEGVNLNCKDEELKAKLYSNRAIAHFYLGEICL